MLLVSALSVRVEGFTWDGWGGRPTWNSLPVGSSHVLASRRDFGRVAGTIAVTVVPFSLELISSEPPSAAFSSMTRAASELSL
jgi:hypothetical protein